MPRKIQDFARESLIQPVLVNVGRAGAANLDVLQVVEYVKQEAKMVYLLECLQKTPPPVIIFSENKNEVDDIQEYLLLKGVEAVAIHGSKTQEERQYAISSFKTGKKDVMVASGVASKGLDFNDIQHVIIFSMPKEIEDYVHQIGRTGRSGKTGIATTFVNMNTPEQTLLDLKYLLIEAGQKYVLFTLFPVGGRMLTLALAGYHPSCSPSRTLGSHRDEHSPVALSVVGSDTRFPIVPSSRIPSADRWRRIVWRILGDTEHALGWSWSCGGLIGCCLLSS